MTSRLVLPREVVTVQRWELTASPPLYLPKNASVLVKRRHSHRDWSVHLSPSDRYR